MSVLCVIPARYGSTRFPGKALAADTGKPLIQHCYEAARGARRVDHVVVATDDDRIAAAVRAFGGKVARTRPDHPCGTNRVAEVAARFPDAEIVLNFQGDEPELDPSLLDRLVLAMEADASVEAATVAGPLHPDDAENPNAVKVVLDARGDALYFSRAPIPFSREGEEARRVPRLLHMGIYAYRAGALRDYAAMAPTVLEVSEKLEQLRWLENGRRMRVLVTHVRPGGIDTEEDYAAFVRRTREAP